MSKATDALHKAIEYEKMALANYKDAMENATNDETRKFLEKIAAEKNQQIDSLHWMMMAESGNLEMEAAPSEAAGEEAPKSSGKCPFSGALTEMGFDMDKMGSEMQDKKHNS